MPHREELWHDRGYLPHCDHESFTQFITYRLHDFLPRACLDRLARNPNLSERRRSLETYLDSGYGSCLLRTSENAELVIENWLRFHGKRYLLHAWCVMPNHVHVLVEPLGNYSTEQIVHSWKSYTAKRLLNRCDFASVSDKRRVWQTEYFDRYIRDARHFAMARSYIHSNPVKAGLVAKAEDWKWNSASLESKAL